MVVTPLASQQIEKGFYGPTNHPYFHFVLYRKQYSAIVQVRDGRLRKDE